MFTSGSFHPAAINYTRKLSATVTSPLQRKDRSSSNLPKLSTISSIGVELTLLAALQGVETSYEERHRIANSIDALSPEAKHQLIAFIQEHDGAAPSAVENNACKLLQCSPSNLGRALAGEEPGRLLELWNVLYTRIIPSLQSMLYPLKKTDPSFDVRRALLVAFRDRVCLKVLPQLKEWVWEWEALLFTVLLETADESTSFEEFHSATNRLLHNSRNFEQENEGKSRSKTLPAKSVHFVEVRKPTAISL